jgi:hypothetical protein
MQHEPKKIALFVDFDNIFLGLRETSREAAEAFATRPHQWLKWIENGMPDRKADHTGPKESRVLIRRCYLNPGTFGKYRVWFTRAGFSVVDCPPLTSQGKNSADIMMVMDMMDALRHETRFDRFVIMSADADFTPVLQRLRAHDRRTAVLVSGQAALAYRASCDRVITEDAFIEHALEIAPPPEPQRAPPAPSTAAALREPELLSAMGRRIYEEASSSGTLSASELPRILREFKEFTPTSNWLGYYSLQSLTEAILAHRTDLRITDDDPWRIAVQGADEPAPPSGGGAPAAPAAEAPGASWDAIRDRVVELVGRMVAESPEPVVMGRAAHAVIQDAGPMITETRWLGHGTFKNLLLSAPELPFRVVAFPLPGFLYDPVRHGAPSEQAAVDGLGELPGEMASLIRRIHQLTDAPKLTPRQYRVLFRVIAKELGRAPYSLMSTGKAVRDQCVERGEPIARQGITQVLRGLSYAGYRFGEETHRPEDLANAFRGNLLNLLRQAQVTLGDDELRMLDDWLIGEPPEPSAPALQRGDAQPVAADGTSAPPAEPDYAAWAEAILAQGSPPHRTQSGAATAPEAEPETVASADARADESHQPDAAADVAPAEPSAPEPWVWPPADALLFEPAYASGHHVPPAPPAGTEPPLMSAAPEDAASDAIPAELSDEHGPPGGDDVPAEWQMADEPSSAPAGPDDAEADAIPAELSDDHGPRGPDVVPADWQMADEPSADVAEPDDAQSDAIPAELSDDHGPQAPDVVPAEWQMTDEPTADVAEPDEAQSDAIPTEPSQTSEPAEDGMVPHAWEPEQAAASNEPEPATTADAAPAEPREEQPADTGDIFTAFWETADPPADAPDAEPAAPPSNGGEPPSAAEPAGEIVTPQWEEVRPESSSAESPPDAQPEPAAQMDAFPSAPSQNGAPEGTEPPASDTASAEEPAAQQPLWWQ